jgi:transketolase
MRIAFAQAAPGFRANGRDRVILSKGHAAPALYAALAAVGLIPKEELKTLRQLGSRLQGHPDRSRMIEVEMSTGSLGQGLSVSLGLALAIARQGTPYYSYCVLGDGEMNSGQVWEAIMFAGVHKVAHLVAILDANGRQNDGPVAAITEIRPYRPKLETFGWAVGEVDGQDMAQVVDAIDWGSSEAPGQRPRMIVANTTKGVGISYMAWRADWHSRTITDGQLEAGLQELYH